MKIFLDFLPIVLFFGAFNYADLHADWAAKFATQHLGFMVSGGVVGHDEAPVLLATVVVILATTAQIVYMLARRQRIDLMLWITFVLVVVLGGATIWFHNATFIKWKPSVLYWAMGLSFWVSQAVFHKNLLQTLIGEQLELPQKVWQRLNFAWIAFFGLMGLLNLYVAYSFSTSTWASFKAFGATGLMIVFMVCQGFYLTRHIKPESDSAAHARATAVSVSSLDIDSALREALAPTALEVIDDSHLHAGHAGAREGRHYTVKITSARFQGQTRVARHRLIYDSLQLLFPRGIHALAIEARAPGET